MVEKKAVRVDASWNLLSRFGVGGDVGDGVVVSFIAWCKGTQAMFFFRVGCGRNGKSFKEGLRW